MQNGLCNLCFSEIISNMKQMVICSWYLASLCFCLFVCLHFLLIEENLNSDFNSNIFVNELKYSRFVLSMIFLRNFVQETIQE